MICHTTSSINPRGYMHNIMGRWILGDRTGRIQTVSSSGDGLTRSVVVPSNRSRAVCFLCWIRVPDILAAVYDGGECALFGIKGKDEYWEVLSVWSTEMQTPMILHYFGSVLWVVDNLGKVMRCNINEKSGAILSHDVKCLGKRIAACDIARGRYIVISVSDEAESIVYDLEDWEKFSGEPLYISKRLPPHKHTKLAAPILPADVQFHPSAAPSVVLYATATSELHLFDFEKQRRPVQVLQLPIECGITRMRIDPSGSLCACGSKEGEVFTLKLSSKYDLDSTPERLRGVNGSVQDLCWGNDEEYTLAIASLDRYIRVFNFKDDERAKLVWKREASFSQYVGVWPSCIAWDPSLGESLGTLEKQVSEAEKPKKIRRTSKK